MVSAKMPAPPSGLIVAIDRRDDRVLQRHLLDRLADAARLVDVERGRLAVRDRAVGAGARADVAEDHEGGRAVVPALADVRAVRVLADGVELEVAHDAAQPEVVLRPRRAHLQPLGLGLAGLHELQRRFNHSPLSILSRSCSHLSRSPGSATRSFRRDAWRQRRSCSTRGTPAIRRFPKRARPNAGRPDPRLARAQRSHHRRRGDGEGDRRDRGRHLGGHVVAGCQGRHRTSSR